MLPAAFATAPPLVQRVATQQQMTTCRRVAPVKAASLLIAFMQDQGCTGYFTAAEIDEWWRWCVAVENLGDMHPAIVREMLAGCGCCLGQKRLKGPEYAAVHTRTGSDRAVLYRIPVRRRSDDGDGAEPPVPERAETGKRPAPARQSRKKRVLSGPESWSGEFIIGEQLQREAA